jgi:hypothetical protein
VSQGDYSPALAIAPDGASPGRARGFAWRLREVLRDFESTDFVSLTLTAIGFTLGIYAITIP